MRKTAGIDVTHVSIKWDRAKTDVSPYASPARQTDYRDLPPAYTFVGTGEPFFAETKTYIEIVGICLQRRYRKFEKMWHFGPDRYL